MQIRPAATPSELQEAARLSRPRNFWWRFLAANWYATAICLLILGTALSGLRADSHLHWNLMALYLLVFGFFLWLSWYRYHARVAKSLGVARSSLQLDLDGVRTVLHDGTSIFLPWSRFQSWREGKAVFVLITTDGTLVLPADEGQRGSMRTLLASKIS